MQFTTPVIITPATLSIDYSTPMLLLGSCFTEEVGERLQAAGFDLLCNPFGTLYNPLSIAACLWRAIDNRLMSGDELVQHDGLWHSWMHHSRFSHEDKDECLSRCNQSISRVHHFLGRKPLLLVTFGTAWVFYHEGSVVANCHKLPPQHFVRRRLEVGEIVDAWQPLVERLGTDVLYTVSPIRHMADGAHGNQLSKATLLLATERLVEGCGQANYFDSYELLMDELRDYRFYARDMCHPSDVAVDVVWERFQATYMTAATRDQVRQHEKEYRQSQHRKLIKLKIES